MGSRSVWKMPVFSKYLHAKIAGRIHGTDSSKKPIKVKRNEDILNHFIGMQFEVHNGKEWKSITVHEGMLGHKFGEFVRTRKFGGHKKK